MAIDASRSMKGFVACTSGATEFDVVLDRLMTDLGLTQVTRFGQATRNAPASFEVIAASRTIHCTNFYDRLQNPDYSLFRRILDDSGKHSFVYLTDGVQSDIVGANQSPSVQLLKEWVRTGHSLAIVAFRSQFDGAAWSEQRQAMIDTVSLPRRPFYMFVFANDESRMDGLVRQMSASLLKDAKIIRFDPRQVSCAVEPAKTPAVSRKSNPTWAMLGPNSAAKMQLGAFPIAEFRCSIGAQYPLSTILPRMADAVDYYRFFGNSFAPAPMPAGTAVRGEMVSNAPAGSTVQITLSSAGDPTSRFMFFAVHPLGDPGELRSWVRELSTDSDAEIANFSRTYRLAWLVEELVRAQLSQGIRAHPFFVTVQTN